MTTNTAPDLQVIAARLIVGVHDLDPAETQTVLASMSTDELRSVAILLASCMNPDAALTPRIGPRYADPDVRVRLYAEVVAEDRGVDLNDLLRSDCHRVGKPIQSARHLHRSICYHLGITGVTVGKVTGVSPNVTPRSWRRVQNDPATLSDHQRILHKLRERGYA